MRSILAALALLAACAGPDKPTIEPAAAQGPTTPAAVHLTGTDPSVAEWIAAAAVPLDGDLRGLDPLFASARVVGLGEATHGQSESFVTKRKLTMHLVRAHGFRVVAYEASAAAARACDDYIALRSDDRTAAIRGLGMLIWAIEENGELLDELRAWNRAAEADDRVRFLGCDAQDAEAVLARLRALLPEAAQLLARADALLTRARDATAKLFGGDRADFDALQPDVRVFEVDVGLAAAALPPAAADEASLRAREFALHLSMYGSPGGRDRAMAELLLRQLDALGAASGAAGETRCALWAHNAHVQRTAMRYMNTDELAQGGHLAQALGDRYVAVGFAFGEGEFQANARDADGRWGFRRYRLSPAPVGSLDATLAAAHAGDFALDLRRAPTGPRVQQWLAAGHGQRWYGGYQVPDDADARTRDAEALMKTYPRADFDALVFLAKTTAARPIDVARVLR